MSYYSREEQETHYNYDPVSDNWKIDSSYPPHVRKLLDHATITDKQEDEDGRVIAVRGYVEKNQIRLFKPR